MFLNKKFARVSVDDQGFKPRRGLSFVLSSPGSSSKIGASGQTQRKITADDEKKKGNDPVLLTKGGKP